MEKYSQLQTLTDLAESLGMEIRPAPVREENPGGAFVRFKGKEILFLDSHAPVDDQINVISSALKGRKELQDRFLPPEIREILEDETGKQ